MLYVYKTQYNFGAPVHKMHHFVYTDTPKSEKQLVPRILGKGSSGCPYFVIRLAFSSLLMALPV